MTLLSPHNKSKNYKSVTHKLDEENLILIKQLKYSLHTQTTIDCGKSSFKSTFNHHSVQSSPCKQKHILQMAAPFSVRKRAWKQIYLRCHSWVLCQNQQAFLGPVKSKIFLTVIIALTSTAAECTAWWKVHSHFSQLLNMRWFFIYHAVIKLSC